MNVYIGPIHNHQKLVNGQTVEHYSAIKRNKLLIHTTWVNLKCIMPGERSQTQKATSCMNPFTGHSGKDKFIGTENKSVVARG